MRLRKRRPRRIHAGSPCRSTRVARARVRTAWPPMARRSGRAPSRHPVLRNDLAGEERPPERAEVGHGGVDPAVSVASHRAGGRRSSWARRRSSGIRGRRLPEARRRAGTRVRMPAGSQTRSRTRSGNGTRSPARRSAPAPRSRRCSTRSARQARTSGGARRARPGTLGRRELLDGHRHQVVGESQLARPRRSSRRCRRCDRRCSIVTPSPISGRSAPSTERAGVASSRALLDQAHDGERRQAFRPARDREPGVERVRDLVPRCPGRRPSRFDPSAGPPGRRRRTPSPRRASRARLEHA